MINQIAKIRDIFKKEEDKSQDIFFKLQTSVNLSRTIFIKAFKLYMQPLEINLDGRLVEKIVNHTQALLSKIPKVPSLHYTPPHLTLYS